MAAAGKGGRHTLPDTRLILKEVGLLPDSQMIEVVTVWQREGLCLRQRRDFLSCHTPKDGFELLAKEDSGQTHGKLEEKLSSRFVFTPVGSEESSLCAQQTSSL